MLSGAVTNRYTRGLFEYASAHGIVDAVDEGLAALARALADNPGLQEFLEHPLISPEQKVELLQQAFGGNLDPALRNFLHLLFARKRGGYIAAVYERFHQLAQDAKGYVEVQVESAQPMPEDDVARVEQELSRALRKQVKATVQVVPDLIAGCRIRMGDRVMDATVRGALDQFRARLLAKGAS
ncbi:MAG: ATP synthase F1 subunit delta [Alicyclobacillaceae bacterium]|nr:ATP synthase F1 subunit delta [Alicyclobacillaceae bacterium]